MLGPYLTAAALAVTLAAPTVAYARDAAARRHPRGVNAREHRQTARIRAGVRSGEITGGELNRLRANEAAVRAEERVYRRSGGGLDPAERRDLQHDLNQTSREIYRAKHNGRAVE